MLDSILRIYTYDEFVLEYGQLSILEDNQLVSESGINVCLSMHLKAALDNNAKKLNFSSLKYFYYVLLAHREFNNNGEYEYKKSWFVYLKEYLKPSIDKEYLYPIKITGVPCYDVLIRRNFSKIFIETEEDSCFDWFELDTNDILEIRKESNKTSPNTYSIVSNRGTFTSTYTSLKFLYSLIEIIGMKTRNNRMYQLYRNGNYMNLGEPFIAKF